MCCRVFFFTLVYVIVFLFVSTIQTQYQNHISDLEHLMTNIWETYHKPVIVDYLDNCKNMSLGSKNLIIVITQVFELSHHLLKKIKCFVLIFIWTSNRATNIILCMSIVCILFKRQSYAYLLDPHHIFYTISVIIFW